MFAKILDVANEKYLFCSFSQWWAIIKSLDHNLCFKRAIMLYLFFFLDLQVSSVRRLFFTCGTISSNGCYSGLCIAEGNCMHWILKKKQMSKFEINFWPLLSHLVPFRPCPSIEISIDKEINIETKEVTRGGTRGLCLTSRSLIIQKEAAHSEQTGGVNITCLEISA